MTRFIHVEQPLTQAGVERVKAAARQLCGALASALTRRHAKAMRNAASSTESGDGKVDPAACEWDEWRPIRDV